MEEILSRSPLFRGIASAELHALLNACRARRKRYAKGEVILREGVPTRLAGVVLSGMAVIEYRDLWGGNSLLGSAGAGSVFAEAYACVPEEPLLITVSAAEDTEVLFLDLKHLLSGALSPAETALMRNLLTVCSRKSLALSRRILHTASKTIRGRLLSYFSECIKKSGSSSFTIPYDRQQLADYLSVDRSALSGELSKMQRDGLIRYKRNSFTVTLPAEELP